MKESPVVRIIRKTIGRGMTRLFVNFVGSVLSLDGSRRFTAGLIKGSSDLIGWHSIVITPEMVGQKIAVFTAIECKRPKGGRLSPFQANFIAQVKSAGGIAGVARSPDEAAQLFLSFYKLIKGEN